MRNCCRHPVQLATLPGRAQHGAASTSCTCPQCYTCSAAPQGSVYICYSPCSTQFLSVVASSSFSLGSSILTCSSAEPCANRSTCQQRTVLLMQADALPGQGLHERQHPHRVTGIGPSRAAQLHAHARRSFRHAPCWRCNQCKAHPCRRVPGDMRMVQETQSALRNCLQACAGWRLGDSLSSWARS